MLQLDPEDWDLYEKAYISGNNYWYVNNQPLSRIIMNPPPDMLVDHINGDTWNNRRSNLRIVTPQQNSFNSAAHKDNKYSPVKGVSYLTSGKRSKRWRARVQNEMLGYFLTEEEAITVVQKRQQELYGEFNRQMCNNA